LKTLAQNKRAYHIVTQDDLRKVSESEHHEDVCLLIQRPHFFDEQQLVQDLKQIRSHTPALVLCLDNVGNPHNLGAITRTAAHFGIKHIVLCHLDSEALKSLTSGAYHRTAEGGSVHVRLYNSPNGDVIARLQKEFFWKVVTTSSHVRTQTLNKTQLPRRTLLLLGSESNGVSKKLNSLADIAVCIGGTGFVESLNVASAAAILMNEFARQTETQRAPEEGVSKRPTRAVRTGGK
jgi:TrmH RNA methyltransferase